MTTDYHPNPLTRQALVAVLKMDSGVTPAHRARLLQLFDDPDAFTTEERPAGWRPASVVAKELGVTLPKLLRWAESGAIASRRVGRRVTLVDPAEVADYAAAHPDGRSGPPRESAD